MIDTIAHILSQAKSVKKMTGIFCANGQVGAIRRKQGFDMVTLTHEGSLLTQAAKAAIAQCSTEPAADAMPKPSTGY